MLQRNATDFWDVKSGDGHLNFSSGRILPYSVVCKQFEFLYQSENKILFYR